MTEIDDRSNLTRAKWEKEHTLRIHIIIMAIRVNSDNLSEFTKSTDWLKRPKLIYTTRQLIFTAKDTLNNGLIYICM